MERANEVKALRWAAEIIKTSFQSRTEEQCVSCPIYELCGECPQKWDLERVQ